MKFISYFYCVVIIYSLFLAFGCGKEGPPVPPLAADDGLLAPFELVGSLNDMGDIVLEWKYPDSFGDKREQIHGFEIFAAIVKPDHCKTCPRMFVKIGTVVAPKMTFSIKPRDGMDYYIKVRAVGFDSNAVSKYSSTISVP